MNKVAGKVASNFFAAPQKDDDDFMQQRPTAIAPKQPAAAPRALRRTARGACLDTRKDYELLSRKARDQRQERIDGRVLAGQFA